MLNKETAPVTPVLPAPAGTAPTPINRPKGTTIMTDNPDTHQSGDPFGDDAWADPAWQVDSNTRPCCAGIGGHAPGCATTTLDALRRQAAQLRAEAESLLALADDITTAISVYENGGMW